MTNLNVPYRKQISRDACGVAAMEMVFRYHHPSKLSKFNQEKVLERLREPCSSGRERVAVETLIAALRTRGLHAGWGRLSPDAVQCSQQLHTFLEQLGVPLMVCQRMNDTAFNIGHYRVLIGLQGNDVVFHDPCSEHGGASLRLPLMDFLDLSRPTPGGNVTGGVAIWAARREVEGPSLLADFPNPWSGHIWSPPTPA